MKCIPFFSFFILFSCSEVSKNSNQGANEITFDTDTIYFKQVNIGDSVTTTFVFHNTGTQNTKVNNVGSTCECTIASYDSSTIIPGGSGKINVVYKNNKDTGNVFRAIVVETNTTKVLHTLFLVGEKKSF
ncbi:MAG: DUF1573 domain-containing protein [Chitinophagaceae bacterium]